MCSLKTLESLVYNLERQQTFFLYVFFLNKKDETNPLRKMLGYRRLQGVTEGYKRLQGITRGYKGVPGITGGYKGLQRGTRDYRGLQGVTEGYKGLQGVTRGYRGLQGVTEGYKGSQRFTRGYRKTWFLVRTSKDTVSSFILKKRFKVEDIDFLDENDGVTPLEKGKCCVFH